MSQQTDFMSPQDLPDTEGVNYFLLDQPLARLVRRYLGEDYYQFAEPYFIRAGEKTGAVAAPLADVAGDPRYKPYVDPYDRYGLRIDEVIYHPAFEQLQAIGCKLGIVGLGYSDELRSIGRKAPRVMRMSLAYLYAQACAASTYALAGTDLLRHALESLGSPALKTRYLARLVSMDPDSLLRGTAFYRERAPGPCRTTAKATEGNRYLIHGDKWFASVPDADLAMISAHDAGEDNDGLFLVERHDDGERLQGWTINRLKRKLGTLTVPSAEVSFSEANATRLGNWTPEIRRHLQDLDRCYGAVSACGIARRALLEALVHVHTEEEAFPEPGLAPMAKEGLCDITVEAEAIAALTLEAVHRLDRVEGPGVSPADKNLLQLFAALSKYDASRRASYIVRRAIELHGPDGIVQDTVLPRLVTDSQSLTVLGGTPNQLALDALEALRQQDCRSALTDSWHRALQEIRLPILRPLTERIGNYVSRLTEAMEPFFAADEARTRLYAKRLSGQVIHATCAVLMLTQAHFEIEQLDDGRKVLVLDRYLRRHIDPLALNGLIEGDRRVLDFFPEIAQGAFLEANRLADIL